MENGHDLTACEHLHLVYILKEALLFIVQAIGAISNLVVQVVLKVNCIFSSELVPQMMNQFVLEKYHSLVAAVVGENFKILGPKLLYVRIHHTFDGRDQLLFEYHAMGIDHEQDCHVIPLSRHQILR